MSIEMANVYVIHCDGGSCENVFEDGWGDTYFEWPDHARKREFARMGWTHVPVEHRDGADFCPNHKPEVEGE